MSQDDNVVASRRILPVARPLMPGDERREEALIQQFNPRGLIHSIDADDPDVQAAQAALEQAQATLNSTIRRKGMIRLVQQGDALDPDKVTELCEKEPWKTGPLTQLNKGLMGFVPEKFEALAQSHPEGSPEYLRFMTARDEAREIYWTQLKTALRQTCTRFDSDPTIKNKRLAYEPLSTALWSFAKTLEPQALWDQQRGRIMWVALNLGEAYMNKYGKDRTSRAGYQQWSLTLEGAEPELVV